MESVLDNVTISCMNKNINALVFDLLNKHLFNRSEGCGYEAGSCVISWARVG